MADPEPGLRITRLFDAPRMEVWREWTEPERFADWFGLRSTPVPPDSVAMDVRPGGVWRLTMAATGEHPEIRWAGEYREVVEPERLVFTITDRPDGSEYELVTVELSEIGDGRTRMELEQSGGHLTPEEYERAGQGWGGFLDDLAARLAA
jgi:uncharacterized protein YndB with AHSA1/START domain